MPYVDFTLEDVRRLMKEELIKVKSELSSRVMGAKNELGSQLIGVKNELRSEFGSDINGVKTELLKIREMLEEDAVAESKRLTRVDRRLSKTARLMADHTADRAIHRAG